MECLPTTNLSQQRYVWAYAGTGCKQRKPHSMTDPCLTNRDICNQYMITLRNKFNALQEISETPTPNDEYENFVNAHLELAAECIPTKLRVKQSSLGDFNS